jgi:hypothetical protein
MGDHHLPPLCDVDLALDLDPYRLRASASQPARRRPLRERQTRNARASFCALLNDLALTTGRDTGGARSPAPENTALPAPGSDGAPAGTP